LLILQAARKILGGRAASVVLPAISNLKKLCNHPKLIYDTVHSRACEDRSVKGSKAANEVAGFEVRGFCWLHAISLWSVHAPVACYRP
jgi:hypothetical protein